MCFPDSGRAQDQQSLLLPEPRAGPQCIELRPLYRWLEREIEVRQRLARRQAREPQRGPDPSLLAPFQLILEQLLEQGGRAHVLLDGAGQDRRQRLGREVESQLHQLVHQRSQVEHRRLGGQRLWPLRLVRSSFGRHRASSANAAYKSTGRRSTGSEAISWSLLAIRPSGVGGSTSAVPGPSEHAGSIQIRSWVCRGYEISI